MENLSAYASDALAIVGEGGTQYAAMNKGVFPVFFILEEEDPAATEKEGYIRIREMECVKIVTAGDGLSAPVLPVNDAIKARFRVEYKAWLADREDDAHVIGTPLTAWPLMSRTMGAQLKANNIRSVEDLSSVSDSNVATLPDGRIWREKAIAWLASSKKAASAAKYAAENLRLNDDIADLRKIVADLKSQMKQ